MIPSLETSKNITAVVFRAWWLDPLIATISFAVAINFFWHHERKRGLSAYQRYRLENYLRLQLGPMDKSLMCYWIGIYWWKMLIPPPDNGDLPDGVPHDIRSCLHLCAEVIIGIILYDLYFFFLHWAMHDIAALRKFHATHHSKPQGTVEARDVLRHSLFDGTLQVLCNIAVQRYNPWGIAKSRCARLLHNVIVTWMLTESHTASPYPNIFRRYCVGVREHRMHHFTVFMIEKNNCQMDNKHLHGAYHRHEQFFGYLDDIRLWYMERRRNARMIKE